MHRALLCQPKAIFAATAGTTSIANSWSARMLSSRALVALQLFEFVQGRHPAPHVDFAQ